MMDRILQIHTLLLSLGSFTAIDAQQALPGKQRPNEAPINMQRMDG